MFNAVCIKFENHCRRFPFPSVYNFHDMYKIFIILIHIFDLPEGKTHVVQDEVNREVIIFWFILGPFWGNAIVLLTNMMYVTLLYISTLFQFVVSLMLLADNNRSVTAFDIALIIPLYPPVVKKPDPLDTAD